MMEHFVWQQRTQVLWGEAALQRLQEAWVGIVGLGGVGSFAAEAIARSGVGHMVLIDRDVVDETNINRQLLAFHSTVGHYKTDVLQARIQDIAPDTEVMAFHEAYTAETSARLLDYPFAYIIDAIDSFPDKLHLIQTCYEQKIPLVSAMGMANRSDPSQIFLADLSKTEVCPLCRKMRYALKKVGIEKGVRVVFSKENPQNALQDKTILGSCAFVPSVAGLYLASEAIRNIIQPINP